MKNRKGFTLIELIVVIAIIGILAAILVPNIQGYTARARNASRMAGLASLEAALEAYREDNGQYPVQDTWKGEYYGGTNPHEGATGYIPNLAPRYVRRLPADPQGGKANLWTPLSYCFGFVYFSNGVDYKVLSLGCPEGPASSSHLSEEKFIYYEPNATRSDRAWAIYSEGGRDW